MLTLLRDLWRRRIEVILTQVANDEPQHEELARLAEHIEADYAGRFLVELLQNAADQAHAAGMDDARVLVVHRDGLFAVANQGQPFQEKGLRDISSMGLSGKRPDESIGNKGIGFKAVFEVSASPEIYSTSPAGGDLASIPEFRFRLDTAPLDDDSFAREAEALVRELTTADARLRKRLLQIPESLEATLEVWAVQHLRRSPPFKFPLEAGLDTYSHRLQCLGLVPSDLAGFQTLIVLPLRTGVEDKVDRALRDLQGRSGASLLFLRGVGSLDLRTGADAVSILRTDERMRSIEDRRFRTVHTGIFGAGKPSEQRWWVIDRTVGESDVERVAVQRAVADLPGPGWRETRSVPLAVALPMPEATTLEMPGGGQFAIGLPTLEDTGLPFWVHAHFHGTLSRKNIDLETNPLNALLLDAAAELAWELLELLKQEEANPEDPPIEHMALPLALGGNGPLREAMEGHQDPSTASLVLSYDGRNFIAPNDVELPDDMDTGLVLACRGYTTPEMLSAAEVVLPHPRLLASGCAREAVEVLGAGELDPARLLARTDLGQPSSLVERWAAARRNADGSFWRLLLRWVASRRDVREKGKPVVDRRHVLPVGGGLLLRPAQVVFLPPSPESDGQGPTAGEVPKTLASSLHMLDMALVSEAAAPDEPADLVRVLTDGDSPLVRKARYRELLQHAVIPALSQEGPERWAFLGLALKWLGALPDDQAEGIVQWRWLLPSADGTWTPANGMYFGAGWFRAAEVERSAEELITQTYPATRRLCSWREFVKAGNLDDARRDSVKVVLQKIGVQGQPTLWRLTGAKTVVTRQPYHGTSADADSPFTGVQNSWQRWTKSIERINLNWTRRTHYTTSDVRWLDGLELGSAALGSLGAWVVEHPDNFKNFTTSTIVGEGGWPTQPVEALWIQVLREANAPIIPTDPRCRARGELRSPAEVCILTADQRRKSGWRHLAVLAEGLDETIPRALGVRPFDQTSSVWAARELRTLADGLTSRDRQEADGLATRLWTRLNKALRDAPQSTDAIAVLLSGPVPAWKGRLLRAVMLNQCHRIYIDDDPVTGRLLQDDGKQMAFLRPSRLDTAWNMLFDVLRNALPGCQVLRTSEATPQVAFEADEDRQPALTWIARALGMEGTLKDDVAAVLAHLGPTNLNQHRPKVVFDRLNDAKIQPGRFLDKPTIGTLWRRSDRLLQVDVSLRASPQRALQELWPALGEPWREVWTAFANAVGQGSAAIDLFFQDRSIDEEARDEAREQLELRVERLRWLLPVVYALWSKRNPGGSPSAFYDEAERTAATMWASWLSCPALDALVARGASQAPPEEVVPACGVTWDDWQDARRALKLGVHRFPATLRRWSGGVEHLSACLLALMASDDTLDVGLAARLRTEKLPVGLDLAPPDAAPLVAEWRAALDRLGLPTILIGALRAVAEAGESMLTSFPEHCDPDVAIDYREHSAGHRADAAQGLWKVARVVLDLWLRKNEKSSAELLSSVDSRLSAFLSGERANRAALVAAIGRILKEQQPDLHSWLATCGVLIPRASTRDWEKLREQLDPPVRPPPPSVGGSRWPELR